MTIAMWLLFVLVFSTTSVAAQDVTEVSNVQELQNMEDDLDGDYVLVDDINASGFDFEPEANKTDTEARFTGSFDGNGHTISNLRIHRPNESSVGLFRTILNASVVDIRLEDANVTGDEVVGSVAGNVLGPDTRIYGVRVSGEVSGNRTVGGVVGNSWVKVNGSESAADVTGVDIVGGLVGSGGLIEDSRATGDVTGEDRVGGLTGLNAFGSINDSYATGDVSGEAMVGGLVGFNIGHINGSYATGNVSGKSTVGGLVGLGRSVFGIGSGTTIDESYATGNVSGETMVGGLVGAAPRRVTESYATGDVTGEEDVGGLVGIVAAGENTSVANRTVKVSYATGDVTGRESVGGLVGANAGFHVEEGYAAGAVTGDENVGGLIGEEVQESPDRDIPETEVGSSYWDVEATGQEESDGGTGLTTDEMTGEAARQNMEGFDFEETWTTSDSYPRLAPRVDNFSTGREEEGLPGFGVLATVVASICAALLVFGRRHVRARGSTASEEEER